MPETIESRTGDPNEGGRIRIFINDKGYFAPKPVLTGAGIKQLGNVPRDYQLFEEIPGKPDDLLIPDDLEVHLKSGDKFHGIPPGNLGLRPRGR